MGCPNNNGSQYKGFGLAQAFEKSSQLGTPFQSLPFIQNGTSKIILAENIPVNLP